MPNDVAHDIWRRSIERVSKWGPLAQFMVAQHFMQLRLGGDECDEESVQAFLSEFRGRCTDWRGDFVAVERLAPYTDLPELAVDFLQAFDLFSLYLCCTSRGGPQTVPLPDQVNVTLEIGPEEVTVEPWPWKVPQKCLRTSAVRIPALPLTSDQQLRERMADEAVELCWRLTPRK